MRPEITNEACTCSGANAVSKKAREKLQALADDPMRSNECGRLLSRVCSALEREEDTLRLVTPEELIRFWAALTPPKKPRN